MLGDKKDMKPLLLKFGMALALSFASFMYSRFRARRIKPPPSLPRLPEQRNDVDSRAGIRNNVQIAPSCGKTNTSEKYDDKFVPRVANDSSMISPRSKSSGDRESYLLPEFNDLVKEFDSSATSAAISPRKYMGTSKSDTESPKASRSFKDNQYEQEIKHLKNMVKILRERERNLEVQLLEYYGLKEQETAVMELQNRLKINNMEAKLFSLKIDSLQADNRRLEAQVADYSRVVGELDTARAKIKILKKKLKVVAEQNKEQIINLQNRVVKLQEQEQKGDVSDQSMQLKLEQLKKLEVEAEELSKCNKKLRLENSDLARRLESTQVIATSVLEDQETAELKEINYNLKQEKENLAKEVEQLQADRCADAEELVYLKWINACLRFELRNYQPPLGKTVARDLSKTLSPKSEDKAKQLIVEYANTEGLSERGVSFTDFDSEWSSQASFSGEPDESSCDNSSATRTHTSSKVKFLAKLRRLVRGKDDHQQSKDMPEERTTYPDDIMQAYPDSPSYSSSTSVGVEGGTDGQSNRFFSPSRISPRQFLDIPKSRSLNAENTKYLEKVQRSSDVGSHVYKSLPMGRRSSGDQLDQDLQGQKLGKYAAVLRESRGRPPTLHRKSRSLSSY